MSEKRMRGDKPYYSLDYYLKETFGRKIYKLSLNAGLTCPNRDGTLGLGGCIFCSSGGSGDFGASPLLSVTEQIEAGKALIYKKLPAAVKAAPVNSGENEASFIAYFQAYTNTYGEISYLRKTFMEALNHKDIALLSIATRPDCLGEEVLKLLAECAAKKPLWVELGLQTIHEDTAELIRRGYPLSVFEKAVEELNAIGAEIITHMILGLPGEDSSKVLASMDYLAKQPIRGIKLQLLHVLKDTDLAHIPYKAMELEDYTDLLIACIEKLPDSMVIHRLTGDGPKKLLISPLWSGNKKLVLNHIHKEMKARDSWQGKSL